MVPYRTLKNHFSLVCRVDDGHIEHIEYKLCVDINGDKMQTTLIFGCFFLQFITTRKPEVRSNLY